MTTKPKTKPKTTPARGTYGALGRRRAAAQGAAAETDLAARIDALKAARPQREPAETKRYGRKGMPGMVQLGVVIPDELKARLKRYAETHELHLAEAAELALDLGLDAAESG